MSKSFNIVNSLSLQGWQEDVIYENTRLFDVVVPVGPNDKDFVYTSIEYTKKNIIGYRNIYLVCQDPLIQVDGCSTIDERTFPFTLEMIGESKRKPWYLQQLLKLYSGKVIKISEIKSGGVISTDITIKAK